MSCLSFVAQSPLAYPELEGGEQESYAEFNGLVAVVSGGAISL
jgi:hypothetical protein